VDGQAKVDGGLGMSAPGIRDLHPEPGLFGLEAADCAEIASEPGDFDSGGG
jgi:hypothetical protein